MKIIKTYESYSDFEDLNLGRFSEKIDKRRLTLNEDGTYDYDGHLHFFNMGLTSLLEIPIRFRIVDGVFYCYNNNLISLRGAPLGVWDHFICDNNLLISLQYAPKEVGIDFDCKNNNLLSKEHNTKIGDDIDFSNNPFSITDRVIETVEAMTYKQQMSELDFFLKHDKNAYAMMLEILDGLGVSEIKHRKEMSDIVKDNDNLKALGY